MFAMRLIAAGATDTDFLAALPFSSAAPDELSGAARRGDLPGFVAALAEHWKRRGFNGPPADHDGLTTLRRGDVAARRPYDRFDSGDLSELANSLATFPRAVQDLPPRSFFKLVRQSLTALDNHSTPASPIDDATPDRHLIARAELPFTAGTLFDMFQGAAAARERGVREFHTQLFDDTDSTGAPQARLMAVLPQWLAAFVRVTRLAASLKTPLFTGEAVRRIEDLAKQLPRMFDARGGLPFCDPPCLAVQQFLDEVPAALRKACSSAGQAAHNGAANGSPRRGRRAGLPKVQSQSLKQTVALHAPDSRWACLRSETVAGSDRLCVLYHQSQPTIELTTPLGPVLRGPWTLEVSVDGCALPMAGEWNCACWHSDNDVEYLELQWVGEAGLRIERQILLSRGGHFAMLADTVAETPGARLDYRMRLPLAAGVTAEADAATRECRLVHGRERIRVFGLALPQDRVQSTPGGLSPHGGALELRQSAAGNGLYAPLVFDWNPSRRRGDADWRTLTITEEGRILPGSQAAGHRLRLAGQQLLIYHSLVKSSEPRAVLGHNTRFETVIGMIQASGEIVPLMLVE